MRKALAERELGSSFVFCFKLLNANAQKVLNLRIMRSQDLQGSLKVGDCAKVNVLRCVSVLNVALYACDEVFSDIEWVFLHK
jgi:hypothetical protein